MQSESEQGLDVESCIKDGQLILLNGRKLPILKSASLSTPGGSGGNMPVVKGKVGKFTVNVLRDTGCRDTGQYSYMLLILF